MKFRSRWGYAIAGACAGAVTGLLGAGGGMVLVPLLGLLTDAEEESIFPCSVGIILPVCIVCLILNRQQPLPFTEALPYLLGSAIGGILTGFFAKKIPTLWLHRFLGVIVLWGGIRNLC